MLIGRPDRTQEDIPALLAGGQNERVAFASPAVAPNKLAESLIAFANARGGILLLGVSGSGKTTGIADPHEARATVQAAGLLSTPPLILPLPQIVDLGGKSVCVVEVPPGLPHVYSLDGAILPVQHRQRPGERRCALADRKGRVALWLWYNCLGDRMASRRCLDDSGNSV